MVKERIGVDRAEERVHPLPAVVDVLTVEIRVEIPDAVHWSASRATFNEPEGTDRCANCSKSLAIDDERIGQRVVKPRGIDCRCVFGNCVFPVKLVVLKT